MLLFFKLVKHSFLLYFDHFLVSKGSLDSLRSYQIFMQWYRYAVLCVMTRTNTYINFPVQSILWISLLVLFQLNLDVFSPELFLSLLPHIFSVHKMWTWTKRLNIHGDPLMTIVRSLIYWVTVGNNIFWGNSLKQPLGPSFMMLMRNFPFSKTFSTIIQSECIYLLKFFCNKWHKNILYIQGNEE